MIETKAYKVLIADSAVRPEGLRMLEKVASLSMLPAWPTEQDLIRAAGDVDAILSRSAMISGPVIAAAPRLKIVSRHGVGVDYVDVDACTRRGILVTVTDEANSQAVSEQAFALLLAAAHRITMSDAGVKASKWERALLVGVELHRKVLGIVGLGRVGSRVAKHSRGFEMEVIACDPYIDPERARCLDVTLVDLKTLLRRADFVSLHVPLTPETKRMIGRDELSLMKPTAILINTARGGVIDEEALIEALSANRIAGAGLDVFAQEPLPANHPLTRLDNVVCSPHVGGQTEEAMIRVAVKAAENILCVFRGEMPSLIVNPEVLKSWNLVESQS